MVFLDFGHGGIDPVTRRYTTAPAKMFDHKKSGQTFHNGTIIYEGVLNRSIGEMVSAKLREMSIPFLHVAHPWIDTPLFSRVNFANKYAMKNPNERHVYISIHNNASGNGVQPGKGRGTEVFTTPGRNNSDKWADAYMNNLAITLRAHGLFEEIPIRGDWSDGDIDKEANFQVIRGVRMPAFLIECLFFDNLEDAKLIIEPSIQSIFANAVIETIIDLYL